MSFGEVIKTIQIKQAAISLLEGDIIKIEPIEYVNYNGEMMGEIQEAKKQLLGERKYSVLLIAPEMGEVTEEMKKMAAGEYSNVNAVAKAIVSNNLGAELLAKFFIKNNNPIVEHTLFKTETEALIWLNEKMKEV